MFVRSNFHHGRDACCVAFKLGFEMVVLVVRAQAFSLFILLFIPLSLTILSNIVNNVLFFCFFAAVMGAVRVPYCTRVRTCHSEAR